LQHVRQCHVAARCHESERGRGAQVPGGTPTAGITSLRQGRHAAGNREHSLTRRHAATAQRRIEYRHVAFATPRLRHCARSIRAGVTRSPRRSLSHLDRGGDAEPRPACGAVIECAQGLRLLVRHRPVTLARRARGCAPELAHDRRGSAWGDRHFEQQA